MTRQLWLLAVMLSALIAPVRIASAESFGIEVHGNFKHMAHTGDTSGKTRLTTLTTSPELYGVGALSGLRGEIMIWSGRGLVTRGHSSEGAVEGPRAGDGATLLATGKVSGWTEVSMPADMDQKGFEAFVIEAAQKHGLSTANAFPFAVRGGFPRVLWHVVTGSAGAKNANAAITDHQGHAQSRVFDQAGVRGVMLGFYSGDQLEGVITHPGKRFHVHYADPDFKTSGHVDAFTVARDTILLLPRH